MPWRHTCAMRQRSAFITERRSKTMSFTALCELFAISRDTGYNAGARPARRKRSLGVQRQAVVRRPSGWSIECSLALSPGVLRVSQPNLENVERVFVDIFQAVWPTQIDSLRQRRAIRVGLRGRWLDDTFGVVGTPRHPPAADRSRQAAENGRHERMHLTLKEATCAPPRSTLRWR